MPSLFSRRRQEREAYSPYLSYLSSDPVGVASVIEPEPEPPAHFDRHDEPPPSPSSPSAASTAASSVEDERVTRFLAALQEIAGATKDADLSTPALYRLLAEQSANALDGDVVLIRIADAGSNGLVVQGVSGVAVHRVAGLLGAFSFTTDSFRSLLPGSLAALDLPAGMPSLLTSAEYAELRELGVTQLLLMPLYHRGELLGRFDIGRREDIPFSVDDRAAGTVLAGLLASTLRPLVRPTGELRSGLESETAGALAEVAAGGESANGVLAVISEAASQTAGAEIALGLLWQEPRHLFEPVVPADSGLDRPRVDALNAIAFAPATMPVLSQLLDEHEPVAIDDAGASRRLPDDLVRLLRLQSVVFAPLRGRKGRLLGAIMLGRTAGESFDPEVLTALQTTNRFAAIVLENALLHDELDRAAASATLINAIGIDLAALTDLDTLAGRIYHHIRSGSAIAASRFCLGLRSQEPTSLDEEQVEYRCLTGEEPAVELASSSLASGGDPLSWVIKQGRPVRANARHPRDRSRWFPVEAVIAPSQSILAVPVRVGHQVIGVMSVQSDLPGCYSADQLDLLETIAIQAGVAIENARLLRALQTQGDQRGSLLDRAFNRQEAERKMLVDDIHNDTLQELASCLFLLDMTSNRIESLDPADARRTLCELRNRLDDNISRLRHLIFQIRPSTLDILGLRAALDEYAGQLREGSGIEVVVDDDLTERLSGELETSIYRIVQEAIDHVRVRNGASRIVVRVRRRSDRVLVTIADDGQGLDPATLRQPVASGSGGARGESEATMSLLSLRERAELAGGELRMANRTGGGSTIQVVLPNGNPVRTG